MKQRGLTSNGLLLWISLAALLLTSAASAQEPQTLSAFSEVIEVRVVNIEVVVTDRQGNRVSGLAPENFRLKVDGDEVPISYFSEIVDGQRVESGPQNAVAEVPALSESEEVRTNYLLFIDDLFSIARDRDRVLDQLEKDLPRMRLQDRMAIVAFDGKEIQMLTSWTRSPRELEDALRAARGRPTHGIERLSELRINDQERLERRNLDRLSAERIVLAGGEAPEDSVFGNLEGVELSYARRLFTQLESSVLAAVSTLRSFASPPGRKVMLVLSGGWPASVAAYTVNDSQEPLSKVVGASFDPIIGSQGELFSRLTDTANRLGYTLYPVDVPGIDREFPGDASYGAGDATQQAESLIGNTVAGQPREDLIHQSLQFLAEQTGGKPLLNALRDVSLQTVIDDTKTYYWLGFSPERQEDDSRHRLEVELVGVDGLRARSREGFVDLSRQTEITMMVESSLLFGNPPSVEPLVVNLGRPKKKGFGKMGLPIEVGVPLDNILLVPTNGRYLAELEIRIVAKDLAGSRSETTIDKININGGRPPRPGDLMWYETELQMRKRDHDLVIAVYDPLSGTILSSSAHIVAK